MLVGVFFYVNRLRLRPHLQVALPETCLAVTDENSRGKHRATRMSTAEMTRAQAHTHGIFQAIYPFFLE
jgi:hypothetical protein